MYSSERQVDCQNVCQAPELRMHHALIIVSRVVAGLVGALAFYLAFFLYEDEDGVWQNRVDNLWRSVYRRAQGTIA